MNSIEKYPALMRYITDRNQLATASLWCEKLREDEREALTGGFADVAGDLARAITDYGKYPYNSAMGEFLGLPLKAGTNEPQHGYYMANQVKSYFALGEATRTAQALINARKPLLIVAARSRVDRKPCRFRTFVGPQQIVIEDGSVKLLNGGKSWRLSSNWSVETCLQHVVRAMETGSPYGESAGPT